MTTSLSLKKIGLIAIIMLQLTLTSSKKLAAKIPEKEAPKSKEQPMAETPKPSTKKALPKKHSDQESIIAQSKQESKKQTFGEIDSRILQVAFCGENYESILILTKSGNVIFSNDMGERWTSKQSHFNTHHSSKSMEIIEMFQNPVNTQHIAFVDRHGEHLLTTNCGQTFQRLSQTHKIKAFQFHPFTANVILSTDNTNSLYLSKDAGVQWMKIASDIKQFAFAKYSDNAYFSSKDRIFAVVSQVQNDLAHEKLVYSDNFMNSTSVIYDQASQFRLTSNFVYIHDFWGNIKVADAFGWFYFTKNVTIDIADSQSTNSIHFIESELLYNTFATIPFENNGFQLNKLAKSDYYGARFKIVQDNIVCRFDLGVCDFLAVHGLAGTVFVNTYDKNFIDSYIEIPASRRSEQSSIISQEYLTDYRKTVVSSNFGETFYTLKAPKTDHMGHPMRCADNCALHLHLQSSSKLFPAPKTHQKMPGVVIAMGSVGDYLADEDPMGDNYLGLYATEDEGKSWRMVAAGQNVFDLLNNGSMLVFAEKGKLTNKLFYSFDFGKTFVEVEIDEHQIYVSSLSLKSDLRLKKFIIDGIRPSGESSKRSNVVVALDMSNIYERECVHDKSNTDRNDYEEWTPSGENEEGCLNGRQMVLIRKKPDRKCYNADQFVNYYIKKSCPCTESDYHCDFGFIKNEAGQCIPNPEEPQLHNAQPLLCHEFFYVTSGYRKNLESGCSGGVEHPNEKLPCGNRSFSFNIGVGSWLWGIIKLALILGSALMLWHIRDRLNVYHSIKKYIRKLTKMRKLKAVDRNNYSEIQLGDQARVSEARSRRSKKDANSIFDDDEEEPNVKL
jgi:photosystem II stability/assembly factor-like uncharacterized protein